MNDPNITMEEYIRLEEEKAQSHGETFNWKTTTFGRIRHYYEEECFTNFEEEFPAIVFGKIKGNSFDSEQGGIMGEYDDEREDFETEFPAIVFNNTSDTTPPCKPTVSPPNENQIDFRISLDESDDEYYTVIFDENLFSYKIIYVNDLKMDSEDGNGNMPTSPKPTIDYFDDLDYFKDFKNKFPAVVYNDGLTSKSDLGTKPLVISESNSRPYRATLNQVYVLDFEGLTPEMRQDLAVRLRMVYSGEGQQVFVSHAWRRLFGGARRRMTWRQFILALGLHTEQEMAEAGFGAYWAGSDRLIPDKGDLRDYWMEISSGRDFLGPAPSYVLIRDPVRRLCHRMIAYSISGRGQAPEKGRKSGARLSGGHFIRRLAMHFGLVSDEGLRGLQVVTRELPLIDLHELGRLNICTRYGDTWAWVAQGPERQQATVTGAHEADEAGPNAEEVAPKIPVLVPTLAQEPPPPPPSPQPRTMSQRIERLEDEVHDLRRDVMGLRGDVASFTTEHSRVST
ncbi:hypothetical protein Tco_0162689 [Tanacetum coccineum]